MGHFSVRIKLKNKISYIYKMSGLDINLYVKELVEATIERSDIFSIEEISEFLLCKISEVCNKIREEDNEAEFEFDGLKGVVRFVWDRYIEKILELLKRHLTKCGTLSGNNI